MSICNRILELRKTLNLKQHEFADPLNISRSYIASLESSKRQPSEALLNLISLQYGVNVDWLKTGEGNMFISPKDSIMNQISRYGKESVFTAIQEIFLEQRNIDYSNESTLIDIGKKIAELRNTHGISLINLAKRSGIAQSSLSYIESGKAQPTVETVYKICTALGIELHDFFTPNGQVQEILPDMRQIFEAARCLTPIQRELIASVMKEMAKDNQKGE